MQKEIGPPVEVVREDVVKGEIYVYKHLLVTRFEGRATLESVNLVPKYGDEIIKKHGTLIVFHDWKLLTSYDPDCRRILVDYSNKIKGKNPSNHFLLKQGLISMGVTVAALVLRNLKVYTKDVEYNLALRDAVEQCRAGVK